LVPGGEPGRPGEPPPTGDFGDGRLVRIGVDEFPVRPSQADLAEIGHRWHADLAVELLPQTPQAHTGDLGQRGDGVRALRLGTDRLDRPGDAMTGATWGRLAQRILVLVTHR
jgi:hypothetical protein